MLDSVFAGEMEICWIQLLLDSTFAGFILLDSTFAGLNFLLDAF